MRTEPKTINNKSQISRDQKKEIKKTNSFGNNSLSSVEEFSSDFPIQRKGVFQLFKSDVSQQKSFEKTLQSENKTGLPDDLKNGIENLSGLSMEDVKVHYNSDTPAQLSAHAFTQGTDIHIANGQEKHLAHEAWHVVQQKQGRVKPTIQMKGKIKVNNDSRLEKEADVMGFKAKGIGNNEKNENLLDNKMTTSLHGGVMQQVSDPRWAVVLSIYLNQLINMRKNSNIMVATPKMREFLDSAPTLYNYLKETDKVDPLELKPWIDYIREVYNESKINDVSYASYLKIILDSSESKIKTQEAVISTPKEVLPQPEKSVPDTIKTEKSDEEKRKLKIKAAKDASQHTTGNYKARNALISILTKYDLLDNSLDPHWSIYKVPEKDKILLEFKKLYFIITKLSLCEDEVEDRFQDLLEQSLPIIKGFKDLGQGESELEGIPVNRGDSEGILISMGLNEKADKLQDGIQTSVSWEAKFPGATSTAKGHEFSKNQYAKNSTVIWMLTIGKSHHGFDFKQLVGEGFGAEEEITFPMGVKVKIDSIKTTRDEKYATERPTGCTNVKYLITGEIY